MPHSKLRRCDICGKYHASYIVTDPKTGRKSYICTLCWKAKFASQPQNGPSQKAESQEEPAEKKPDQEV